MLLFYPLTSVSVDIVDGWDMLRWMHICDLAGYMRSVPSINAFCYPDICAHSPSHLPPSSPPSTPSSTLSRQTLIHSHTHTEGAIYYSSTSSATYQTGADTTVRGQFVSNGSLDNSQDGNFRAIGDDWSVLLPVLARAASLLQYIASVPTRFSFIPLLFST